MATITSRVRAKQPTDIRRVIADFGPFMATGDVASAPSVTIEEIDKPLNEFVAGTGPDYTGAMYVSGSITFSSGGVFYFDVKAGSDNKDYGARVKASVNPGNREESLYIMIPVRKRVR